MKIKGKSKEKLEAAIKRMKEKDPENYRIKHIQGYIRKKIITLPR
jgi:hypothetical protein